jgi:hypothetical protein
MSKHLFALAHVVGLAVVLAGCSKSGTETGDSAAIIDTINSYVEAYNARDYEKCLSYLTGWDPASSEEDRISVVRLARGYSGQMTVEGIEDIVPRIFKYGEYDIFNKVVRNQVILRFQNQKANYTEKFYCDAGLCSICVI